MLALGGSERAPCADVGKIAGVTWGTYVTYSSTWPSLRPSWRNGSEMLGRATPDRPVLDIFGCRPTKLDLISGFQPHNHAAADHLVWLAKHRVRPPLGPRHPLFY